MKSRKKGGFTLIELIATIAILSILGLTVQQTFDSQANIYKKRSAQQELQFDAKKIMTLLNKDIKQGRDSTNQKKYIITDKNELTSKDEEIGRIWNQFNLENYKPILYIEKYDDKECFYSIKNDKTLVKISFDSLKNYKKDPNSYPKLKGVYDDEFKVLEPISIKGDKKDSIESNLNLNSSGQIISDIYYFKGDYYTAYYYDNDTSDNEYIVKIVEDTDTGRELEKDAEGNIIYKEEIIAKSVDNIEINQLINSHVYNIKIELKDDKGNEKTLSSSISKIDYGGGKR